MVGIYLKTISVEKINKKKRRGNKTLFNKMTQYTWGDGQKRTGTTTHHIRPLTYKTGTVTLVQEHWYKSMW